MAQAILSDDPCMPVQRRIAAICPAGAIAACHQRSGWRHALIAGGHLLILAAACTVAATQTRAAYWIPAALVAGAGFFGCTVLLHEVVHRLVFTHARPRCERLLGLLYGLPIALSPSQYTRWHLDHHRHLGADSTDPKRAYLSPRAGAGRWAKLRFLTPLFIPLYQRAARRAAMGYPLDLQRRIFWERIGMQTLLAAMLCTLGWWLGPLAVVQAWLIPAVVVFPLVFTINRIGQHYWIDDRDPAKSGSRVDGNPAWHWLFLWSNFHLEHHYYPGVPCYRLVELNRTLRPFFAAIAWPTRCYRTLIWQWFIRDQPAHTAWKSA